VGRLTKKEIERKLEILDEIASDLKEKSTPKKNYYTVNNLHSLANERFKLENITVISSSTIKGIKKVNYLKKYSDDVEAFRIFLKKGKDTISSNVTKRISDLEMQVGNLISELVLYKDEYMELKRKYKELNLNYDYIVNKKNEYKEMYENLKREISENQ
jgi:uncharacterized protein with von Willebrand factor type A (vWA) domain